MCHATDGYINVGHRHVFICKTHKTAWAIGSDLFSSCMEETPEQQSAEQERIGFVEYREVEPHRSTEAREIFEHGEVDVSLPDLPDPQDDIHTSDQIRVAPDGWCVG